MGVGIFFLLYAFFSTQLLRLSYQSSKSMPQGWYGIHPLTFPISRGEVVVFSPPPPVLAILYTRHWIQKKAWLMKKVLGLPGDLVCLQHQNVWINQEWIASIASEDSQHRALPQLSFCRKLSEDEYFLMSTYIPESFDSRYFGPISRAFLRGEARPIWLKNGRIFT